MNADNWSSPVFYVGHMIDFNKLGKQKHPAFHAVMVK